MFRLICAFELPIVTGRTAVSRLQGRRAALSLLTRASIDAAGAISNMSDTQSFTIVPSSASNASSALRVIADPAHELEPNTPRDQHMGRETAPVLTQGSLEISTASANPPCWPSPQGYKCLLGSIIIAR